MSIEVKNIGEALGVLKAHCVAWTKVNRIENSLWDSGVAFFNRSHLRVAYYDEANHLLSIN